MTSKIELTSNNWNRIDVPLSKMGLPREAVLALEAINCSLFPSRKPVDRKPLLSLNPQRSDLNAEEIKNVTEMMELFLNYLPEGEADQLKAALKPLNLNLLAEALLILANRRYAQDFFDWLNLSDSILTDLKKTEKTALKETTSAVSQVFHYNRQQIAYLLEKTRFLATLPIHEKKILYSNLLKIKDEMEDLVKIEKIKKASLHRIGKWAADKKRYKILLKDYKLLDSELSKFQNALELPQDRMEEFDMLSIHAKLPRRCHLTEIAFDFILGFKNVLSEEERVTYSGKIDEWSKLVTNHPHIGNQNPHEPLSIRKSVWTKQQKQFQKAFKPVIDEMVSILKTVGKSANDLAEARNAILNDPARWKAPIEKKLSVPGELNHSIQHTMTAFNAGYPSSLFRGRTGERQWVLPNAHAVSLKTPDGTEMHYLSSATPVEFFASGPLRSQATETQCMEILLNGALSTKKEIAGTRAHPRKVPMTAVSLLTPNPIIHFLLHHSAFRRISDRLMGSIDASNDESRLLAEMENAMRSLLSTTEEQRLFQFCNVDGHVTRVETTKDDAGNSCFKITNPDGSEEFITYELSLFNVGVNRFQRFVQKFKRFNYSQEAMNLKGWEVLKAQKDAALLDITAKLNSAELPTWAGPLLLQKAEVENKRQAYLSSERSPIPSPKAFQEWVSAKDRYAAQLEAAEKLHVGADYLALTRLAFDIVCLSEEVEDQLEFKDYLSKEGINRNAYSLPSALICLSSLIGNASWTGCRSGKDRTSLQRMEIATRVGMRISRGRFLNYREMEEDPNTYRMREEAALNSGQHDQIALRNIGSQGLNLRGLCKPYVKRELRNGKIIPHKTAEISIKGVYKAFKRQIAGKNK